MYRLTLNENPHLIINDYALLIYASWGVQLEMLLTQDNKFPKHALNAIYDEVLKGPIITDENGQTYRSFFGFKPSNDLIDTDTPKGLFVSLQFEGTIYRFLKWVFEYRGLTAPEPLLQALVKIATQASSPEGKKLSTYLPEPMAALLYDWKASASKSSPFKQNYHYEGNSALYVKVGASGFVTKEPFYPELTAIQVKHAPPIADVLTHLFIKPFNANEAAITKLVS